MPAVSVRDAAAALAFPGVRLGAGPAEPVRWLPSGIESLDRLLGGGWPRGHVSEIAGGASSGRTAVAQAALAAATRAGELVALIDVRDALDPASLAAAGAVLERVLWVRPRSPRVALKCAELVLDAGGFGLVVLDGVADVPFEARRRQAVPPQVWPRLARVTRRSGAVCLVCGGRRLAGAAAALALRLTQRRARWDGRLFAGLATAVALERSRFGPAERAIALVLGERLSAIDGVKVERLRTARRRGGEEAVSGVTG